MTDGSGHTSGYAPARSEIPAAGVGAGAGPTRKRNSVKLRLADGSESDCRAGIHLAREAHLRTIFRDIAFSETKARAIFDKAMAEPERFGPIYANVQT
ncbi:hypothetical protein [Roseibium sediminicola]|uniref:Uncharacterized protein n=1 Tax=Roseibium sediminicola TaxID=2933272 RepID=A0ABT0H0J2_9HYPH|nr:hypothetical protein [Roseibium sp. CAU 1639]MCK7615116.1 hypothetical protein [Roseibium sp. CAU 1639]